MGGFSGLDRRFRKQKTPAKTATRMTANDIPITMPAIFALSCATEALSGTTEAYVGVVIAVDTEMPGGVEAVHTPTHK